MNSFSGRLAHWFHVSNPLNGFTSDSDLKKMQADIKAAQDLAVNGVATLPQSQAQDILAKKRVLLSCVHPDTGEFIKFFGRTSSFVFMNLPIIGAMALTPPTPFNTIFWQWINQTYNAGFNYGNRNASSETKVSELLKSYGLAVASAIASAMTLRKITNMALGGRTGLAAQVANSVVNYGAVSFSSSLNVYFMRMNEMQKGISVLDPESLEKIGTSKKAAEQAVF